MGEHAKRGEEAVATKAKCLVRYKSSFVFWDCVRFDIGLIHLYFPQAVPSISKLNPVITISIMLQKKAAYVGIVIRIHSGKDVMFRVIRKI